MMWEMVRLSDWPDRPPGWTPPPRRIRFPDPVEWWHALTAGLVLLALGGLITLFAEWWNQQPTCDECGANIGAGLVWLAGMGLMFAGTCSAGAGLILWGLKWNDRRKAHPISRKDGDTRTDGKGD